MASSTIGSVMDEVRRRGMAHLVSDTLQRFVKADGSSHGRALAYQGIFMVLSGFIGLIGLASVLGAGSVRSTVLEMSKTVAPGPSGQLLQEAANRSSGGGSAALIGLGAALVSGSLAMAQIERSANRLRGRTQDRTGVRRFAIAFGIALTAGVLAAAGLLVLGGGTAIATGFGWKGTAADLWLVLRWVIGIGLAAVGIYLIFRWAPDGSLGSRGDLLAGMLISLMLWVLFTIALTIWFSISSSSQTYGPLATVIALLLWTGATSLALHLGMAFTAELSSHEDARPSAADAERHPEDNGRHVRIPTLDPDRH